MAVKRFEMRARLYTNMKDIYFELRCLFPKAVVDIIMREVRNHTHSFACDFPFYVCKTCEYKIGIYEYCARNTMLGRN